MGEIWATLQASYTTWRSTGTEFACFYCDVRHPTEVELFRHIGDVHRVSQAKYQADNPNYMVQAPRDRCMICGCCLGSVQDHVKDLHGLEPEVYYVR